MLKKYYHKNRRVPKLINVKINRQKLEHNIYRNKNYWLLLLRIKLLAYSINFRDA